MSAYLISVDALTARIHLLISSNNGFKQIGQIESIGLSFCQQRYRGKKSSWQAIRDEELILKRPKRGLNALRFT